MKATKAPPIPVSELVTRLRAERPDARYELDFANPLELLIATILAAQCTDERVNRVTKDLFRKYRSARDYACADIAALEEAVRSTGFYRNKAKAIQAACKAIEDRFGGQVPGTMAELVTLPGVARKTANVVLNTAFGIPSGVIVDTHVARLAPRMGLSAHDDPDRIEVDLMRLVPKADWTFFGPAMVLHGRYVCTARSPRCGECSLEDLCPKRLEPGVTAATPAAKDTPMKKTAKEAGTKSRAAKPKDAPAADPTPTGGGAGGRANAVHSAAIPPLPASWQSVLAAEREKPYFRKLEQFMAQERGAHAVFPPTEDVFSALALTPYEDVRVVLIGQDPYHDDGQAHGLCFSVRPGVTPPPSLVNMFKEMQSDLGLSQPATGYLESWAKQGLLMLNAVLTVRAHSPNSHKNQGWETFTDAVLQKVNERRDPVVFVLWGGYAQKKAKLIDGSRHVIIQSAHPSPLSARNGFFGSKPFSGINDALRRMGKPPIDWRLA